MANKDKLLESAQKFLAKGQLAKAIGEYQKLVEAFPKDYRNRQKLAELLSREKRNDEAQPHYEAVARNFTDTGFYLKAIAIYKQMQKIEPGRVDIYLRLAELNEKQGLIGNALNEYRSLVAFYDKNRMARESVGVLQKMIALDPENLGFRGKLIETLVAVNEQGDALEQLRTLVSFLAGKGEPAKVVKLYEKFLDICPEDVDTRLPLAEALLGTAQGEKALVLLKNLLKQTPDHPALLTVLTDCHMALGNHADARLTCQHLLKEQPQDLDLRERYVRICIAGKDYDRALESLEESKEQFYQAERVAVLKELYATLQPFLAGNPRLQATLAAIGKATGTAGTEQVAPPTASTADAEEETADAALVDVAISDVEQLDLIGEAIVPPAEVPPLGAPVPPAPAAENKGGFELELDLDLDLELPAPAPPTPAPAAPPEPPSAPAVAPAAAPKAEPPLTPAPPMEMELELDLGGLEEFGLEPPAGEELSLESEPEPSPTIVTGIVEEETVAPATPEVEELALPEFGDLEFEVEPSPETPAAEELPSVDEVAGLDLPELEGLLAIEAEAGASVTEEVPEVAGSVEGATPEVFEEVETAEAVEKSDEVAFVEQLEELEEVEELDELEAAEEFEELEEVEELEDVEESIKTEEFEAAETLEELEELEEFEEPAGEIEAAPSTAPPSRLRDDIEEAEFYLRQGLLDDAERLVLGIQKNYGEQPELVAMLAEIEAQRQVLVEAEPKDAIFDLTADIKDSELLGATDFLGEAGGGEDDEFSLAAPAEETDEDEDAQSHFDLGIAYKEMGLLDDAIAEFGKALRDPSRQLDCLTLKGQCLADAGHFDKAEATYKEGLMLAGLTEEGMIALRYELGLLYEGLGRPVEALESYQVVADRDLFYRDVTDKLKALRQQLGIDDQAIESVSEGGNGRDRISFL